VAYVGIRGPQPGYGHGGPRIVGVVRDGEKRTLTLADERYLRQESFEWGYDGGGPALLAQAILNDYLGIEVDLLVARTFMREVIAQLPSDVRTRRARRRSVAERAACRLVARRGTCSAVVAGPRGRPAR
jgi:Family of unknown function (DUF6166)